MPILRGSFAAVDGFPTEGTVTAWSPRLRPSSDFAVTGEKRVAPLTDGKFEIDLVPGEVQLNVSGNSQFHPLSLTIPTQDEPVELLDLLEGDFEYAPEVVQAAQQAARDAREYLRQSREIAEAFGSVERVGELEASARASATSADGHRRAAAASATDSQSQAIRSEQEADRATDEATAAAESAGHASASAAAAADSEDEAGKSQVAAAGSAEAAAGSATVAEQHRDDADEHRKSAATSEMNAKTSETSAAQSATDAEQSAETAEQRVTAAVAEATGITAGHADAAQASSERSAQSARDARASQQSAAESAEAAAEIAIGNVPGATEDTRGLIRLNGDLAGTADAPTVPALSLAAPGASVQLTPQEPGWGYATAPVADTPTGWSMDGTWVSPPHWMSSVMVMVDWCGGTSVALRGRRSDGSAVTLETVPAGTPETHRPVTVRVELADITGLAVAATWSPEDLEADCTVSLLVVPLPKHSHPISEVEGLQGALQSKVNGNDDRLSDPRMPLPHEHEIDQVRGLRAVVDRLDALEALVRGRPVEWEWDGTEPWVPPEHALPGDRVWNTDSNDVHRAEEVISDE
jgi:chemotaxis protein histidine kinase CheA